MRKKKGLTFTILALLASLTTAHEFWLEPGRFYYEKGESASLNFRVGENFVGEPWTFKADRILRMQHYSRAGVDDLRKTLRNDQPIKIPLTSEGAHVIVMESDAAFIKLDGQKFTEYLEEDGLDDVRWQRKRDGISEDSASELYSRHTKLILQSGASTDDSFQQVFGLPLEIIPDQNPALLKRGDLIGFKILYNGKPLFGAKAKVWNRYNNRTSVQNIFTQQDGRIETHVSNPGAWMVSVVKMVPSTDRKAKYRSYWATLVFGVR